MTFAQVAGGIFRVTVPITACACLDRAGPCYRQEEAILRSRSARMRLRMLRCLVLAVWGPLSRHGCPYGQGYLSSPNQLLMSLVYGRVPPCLPTTPTASQPCTSA